MSIIKAKSVIGLKVISMSDGKEVSKIHDIVYNPVLNQVRAFIIDAGGWFSGAKTISIEDIESIGSDAVTIKSVDSVKELEKSDADTAAIASHQNYMTKDEVYSKEGNKLGVVSDIHFDSETGKVMYLEISQGLLNALSGVKMIDISDVLTIGDDKIIVDNHAETSVQEQSQTQGLAGVTKSAKENVSGIADLVKEKAMSAVEAIKSKSSEVAESIQDSTTKENISGAADTVKHDATEVVHGVKEVTADMVTGAKKVFVDTTHSVAEKIEDMRISNVIGKKLVNVVLLSKDNETIASPGDIITHQIVDMASENDQLEKLLTNTADLEPGDQEQISNM
jgi:uncharacterized protein YrrD